MSAEAASRETARARDAAGDVGPELAAELLSRGREITLRARGTSMAPLIRDGDLLTLASLDAGQEIRPGDVLAAISRGRLLVHRAVRVRGGDALLQGDALWGSDGWFSEADCAAQLVGRVKAIHREAVSANRPGTAQLSSWRLGGRRSLAWTRALPLVRSARGLVRRLRGIRSEHSLGAFRDAR